MVSPGVKTPGSVLLPLRGNPVLQYSNTPTLQHSITPSLRLAGFEADASPYQIICGLYGLVYDCAKSMKVENLRSPYVKTGGLYYFARMIDKIRLNAANLLPGEYQQVLGLGFDGRTCRFLRIDYKEFAGRVLQGGTDEELLQWCFARGRTPGEEEIAMWNDWVRKKGWRDETSARLEKRLKESGFEERRDIETMFDYIDLDEGRDPRHRNWGYNGEYE